MLLIGWQGLEMPQKSEPILLEERSVGDGLAVNLVEALAMEVKGNIEAICDVELDDKEEAARSSYAVNIPAKYTTRRYWKIHVLCTFASIAWT